MDRGNSRQGTQDRVPAVASRFLVQVTQLKTLEVEVEAASHSEALDVAFDKARGGGYSFDDPNLVGVTFVLYNGTSMCASVCGNASGSGTLTFNAPPSGPNAGTLLYSCNSVPCGGGSGNFLVQGAPWSTSFTGLIYNPGGDCNITSNAGEQITGQLICQNVALQGGSVSAGTGVTFGGSSVPTPQYLAQLIE
jgi:hypothetical protein